MPTVTTFANGQVLTSSALTLDQINVIIQPLIANILGILTSPNELEGTTTAGSNSITLVTPGPVYPGLTITGTGIPANATVTSPVTGSSFTISAPASASGTVALTFADPNAFSKVRVTYPRPGQPGFGISEDVCSVRCSEVDVEYNKVRNPIFQPNDDVSLNQVTMYQKTWEIFLSFYGPNSNTNARIVKSSLLLDWVRQTLSPSSLYLVTGLPNVVRVPELVNQQWQERSDFKFYLNEGITETITVPSIASIEIIGQVSTGQIFDVAPQPSQQ
jgi:hypothetical protein